MPVLSLAHIGMHELTPPELVSCAAAAGFNAINITLKANRPGAAQFPIQGDTPMMRETVSRLRETGLRVSDVTSLWITPDMDPRAQAPLFDAARQLGAKSFIVVGHDSDHVRTTDTFARLCQIAAPFDLTLDLEFMLFTAIKTIDEAHAIVRHAAQPNGGVAIDCLHFSRAGSPIEMIGEIEPKYIHLAQLCDAPAQSPPPEGLAAEARTNRLPAGQGGLKLREILNALPIDIDISVEIPLAGDIAHRPPLERARLLNDTSRSFLRSVGRPY
jgi:sugar phosphate isomerase/epimerase